MAKKNFFQKQILVVDDSPVIRTLIANFLKESGYQYVDMAENGRVALECFEKKRYDLVLTDFDMPEMNGEALVDALRQKYQDNLLIVVLSAQASKQKIVEMMRKADDYIIKDDMEIIKADILFVLQKCFETFEIAKENERLLRELQEKDHKMQIELETARDLLLEFKEIQKVSSNRFQMCFYNVMSNTIGGDFFTAVRLSPSRIGLLLGDISGHGIPAALLMLSFKDIAVASIRNGFSSPDPTVETMRLLNQRLLRTFPESKYATISYLILDEEEGKVIYTNEFQNPILYQKQDGSIEELDNGHVKLIGMYTDDILEEFEDFEAGVLPLEANERIFLFTDGITEGKNPKTGEEFGLDGLKRAIQKYAGLPINEQMKSVLKEFYTFIHNETQDDITFLGVSLRK